MYVGVGVNILIIWLSLIGILTSDGKEIRDDVGFGSVPVSTISIDL